MHGTEFQFLEYAVNAMTATKGRRNFLHTDHLGNSEKPASGCPWGRVIVENRPYRH